MDVDPLFSLGDGKPLMEPSKSAADRALSLRSEDSVNDSTRIVRVVSVLDSIAFEICIVLPLGRVFSEEPECCVCFKDEVTLDIEDDRANEDVASVAEAEDKLSECLLPDTLEDTGIVRARDSSGVIVKVS